MDMYKSQAEQRQNCSNEAMKTAEDRDLNRLKALYGRQTTNIINR